MARLLTSDKKHVEILTSVRIDKSLPKYRKIDEAKKNDVDVNNINNNGFFGTPKITQKMTNEVLSYENLKNFLEKNDGDVTDFNIKITSTLNNILKDTSFEGLSISGVSNSMYGMKEKPSLWKTIKEYFKKKKEDDAEEKRERKFDILKFFADVHGIIEDDEAKKYIDRITDYIQCIGYTEKAGQTALKEKLIRGLIINKLESILFAKGYYRALTEEAIVELAQNCPKSLSLDYIENYVKNIPVDVIKKKLAVDELQVFDNYVILHYDPKQEAVELTDREKKKIVDKKKDPILFGVINGSKKLYFIADWIDESMEFDITWDKLVEYTSKDVREKGFLTDKIK